MLSFNALFIKHSPEDLAWQNKIESRLDNMTEAINGIVAFLQGSGPVPHTVAGTTALRQQPWEPPTQANNKDHAQIQTSKSELSHQVNPQLKQHEVEEQQSPMVKYSPATGPQPAIISPRKFLKRSHSMPNPQGPDHQVQDMIPASQLPCKGVAKKEERSQALSLLLTGIERRLGKTDGSCEEHTIKNAFGSTIFTVDRPEKRCWQRQSKRSASEVIERSTETEHPATKRIRNT